MKLYDRIRSLWVEALALLRESRSELDDARAKQSQAEPLFRPNLPPFRLRIGEAYYPDAEGMIEHCRHGIGMQALLECWGAACTWEA